MLCANQSEILIFPTSHLVNPRDMYRAVFKSSIVQGINPPMGWWMLKFQIDLPIILYHLEWPNVLVNDSLKYQTSFCSNSIRISGDFRNTYTCTLALNITQLPLPEHSSCIFNAILRLHTCCIKSGLLLFR